MNKVLWTVQALIALVFAGAGGTKLATPPATLRANPQMAWSQDFADGQIKAIGSAEVAGALGLIIPAATGIAPVLTPIAGVSLAVLMGGATATHAKRGEPAVVPAILGLIAMTTGLLRWRRQRGGREATTRA